MENNSWVCFQCRECYRRSSAHKEKVICAKCNNNCRNVGSEIKVPKKTDIKAWKKLQNNLIEQDIYSHEISSKESVRLKHDAEQGEKRLEILENAKNKKSGMRALNKQLKKRNLQND